MAYRPIKFGLILAALAADYRAVFDRLDSLEGMVPAIVFAGLYLLLLAGIIAAALARPLLVRLALGLVFAAAMIMQYAFEWTTAGPLTYQAFINLVNATGQTEEAIAQHGRVLAQAACAGLVLLTGIALPPGRRSLAGSWAGTGAIAALGLLTAVLFLRGGEGSRALPAAYPALSFSLFLAVQDATRDRSPREPARLPHPASPAAEDIVLLVDESIAGNYLDLDNPEGVRSGLLEPRPGIAVANFGYAASINKCSANSNAVLRFGGTPSTFQTALAHWPSIWSYAHRAGLRTVYLDGQSTHGHLQNMMGAAERGEIDEFVQYDNTPAVMRDMAIADSLAAHLNNNRREFIYVNKIGAHFPIADKYPAEYERFRPALPRGQGNPLLAWSSDRRGFSGTATEWQLYRNAYRNTLMWNVGHFFDRLFAAARLDRAVILYTSDHGQDLHERHNPGNNTHCGSQNAAQEEGLVPLAVIQGRAVTVDWTRHLASNRNRSSDFRIFPTALALMGYDRAALRPRYGVPLDEPGHDAFAYNLDFSEPLLGRKASFRPIDLSQVVAPPRSDFAERGR